MNARDFERRFRYWQGQMLMADWKIASIYGPLEHDEKADCEAKPEYREARCRFDHRKIPTDQVDAFCVHELGHVVNWPVELLAEQSTTGPNGYAAARYICETVVTKWEEIILNVAGNR